MLSNNLYSLLNVLRTASQDEIKKAYKKAALKAHPDKGTFWPNIGGSREMFQALQNAFDTLSDPSKRKQYDKELRLTNSKDGTTVVAKADTADDAGAKISRDDRRPKDIIELPSNPSSLSISELKGLFSSLGISSEGCIEKQDYVDKITAYKKNKSGVKSPKASKDNIKTSESTPIPKKVLPNTLPAVKVISVGAQEVGKSCIIKRYCEGRFVKRYIPTIGVDYGVKVVDTRCGSYAVHFFDLSGNDDFKLIRQEFYTNAQGAIIVFDVNDKETLKLLSGWESEIKSNGLDLSKLQVVLIGNKVDIGHREVTETEASKWAKSRGWNYYDCSANTGTNISQALDNLFNAVAKNALEARKMHGIV